MTAKFEIGEPCYLIDDSNIWQRVEVTNRRFWKKGETFTYNLSGQNNWMVASNFWGYAVTPDPEGLDDAPPLWDECYLRKINPDTNKTCIEGWSLEKFMKDSKTNTVVQNIDAYTVTTK